MASLFDARTAIWGTLFGACAVVAGVAAADTERVPAIATNVGGAPSPADNRTEALDAAAAAEVAEAAAEPARRSGGEATPMVGDRGLGTLDLGAARRDGDGFVIDLDGGRTARLTLDPRIQDAAEKVLARAKPLRGAVVVMSTDGRLLAAAGLDGEKPAPSLPFEVWAPAASVFKIVTAAALVDAGVRPSKEVCYHGGVRSVLASNLTDTSYDDRCDDLAYALAKSQNAIIAKLAHRHLDAAALRETAARFGFGREVGFAVPAESGRAEIPDGGLELAKVAAGFWHTELSPLGGAVVANTIASGGLAVTPRVIDAVALPDGSVVKVIAEPPARAVSASVAADVAAMMVGTTTIGTARKGFHDPKGRRFFTDLEVAGKTGTLTRGEPSYMQYSWFVGFAPADNPQVVVSVLLGNPPRWHLKAHTAARLVLQNTL